MNQLVLEVKQVDFRKACARTEHGESQKNQPSYRKTYSQRRAGLFSDQGLVGFYIQKVCRKITCDFDFYHPTTFVRGFIDHFRGRFQFAVEFNNFTCERHEKVRYSFYGFHSTEDFTCFDGFSYCFYFDVYDVSQFLLGKVSDSDCGNISFNFDPLVVFGVL